MELWQQVSDLQTRYERVNRKFQEMNGTISGSSSSNGADLADVSDLVGDKLLGEYKKVLSHEKQIDNQRRELHSIAQTRHLLELEAIRYIPWLEHALKQGKEDIVFCDKYKKQLDAFQLVNEPAKIARDKRLFEQKQREEDEEKRRKKKEEEEDRKKFMESAMSKQTEAQPGMVWNRATGEYQHLNQDESWRD